MRDSRRAMARGGVAGGARPAARSPSAGRRDWLRPPRWLRADAPLERLRSAGRRPGGARRRALPSRDVRAGRSKSCRASTSSSRRPRFITWTIPPRSSTASRPRSRTGDAGRGRVGLGGVRRGDSGLVLRAPRTGRGRGLATPPPRRVGGVRPVVECLRAGVGGRRSHCMAARRSFGCSMGASSACILRTGRTSSRIWPGRPRG